MVSVSLSYSGALSDNNVIDMYDAARGLSGFHRSLALTTHLVLNGEIITQAPSLKGAQLIVTTPEEGSWKVTAVVLAGIWAVASVSKDSVPGHLLFSAYDYVISSTLGFHVDFDKSLGEQYETHLKKSKITSEKMDSLIEKCEPSIVEIHRPIVASKTATRAELISHDDMGKKGKIGPEISSVTYDYISKTVREKDERHIEGAISSFNINTYKGRIFVFDEQRPIPFELADGARSVENLIMITTSLRSNASRRFDNSSGVRLIAHRLLSSNGRLKAIMVSQVERL